MYVGRCPDLFLGGCHGDDPVQVYAELCEIVEETVTDLEHEGKALPEVKTRPPGRHLTYPTADSPPDGNSRVHYPFHGLTKASPAICVSASSSAGTAGLPAYFF